MEIDRELLQTVFDIATHSMDFGSGFLDNSEVDALRSIANLLGVDPVLATPSNFVCQYKGQHDWMDTSTWSKSTYPYAPYICRVCRHTADELPAGATATMAP